MDFRCAALQITALLDVRPLLNCFREQFGLLMLYQPPCYTVTSLLKLLKFIFRLMVEFPRLMVLGDLKLSTLGMEQRRVYGHRSITDHPRAQQQDSDHTPNWVVSLGI